MTETVKESLQRMAAYHEWAYGKLYEAVDKLSPELYKKDVGLFFNSIHGTLNHLYLADNVWLSRFNNTTFAVNGLDQELYADRLELKKAIFATAASLISFCDALDPLKLIGDLNFVKITDDKADILPYSGALSHVFNHATHHRGQCSAALTMLLGKDAGPVLDLSAYLRQCQK
jgi:uncharacterized damage-inducible protein DinB